MSQELATKKENIELRTLFLGLQNGMIHILTAYRKNIKHPSDIGNASELKWEEMLSSYLPNRYEVKKATVLDSKNNYSDQIDLVIFDRQYSPFLFNHDGITYIPAESVYAVFEIRQKLSKENIEYAGSKIESVRKLHRTSAPIYDFTGKCIPKKLHSIIGGILTLDSSWSPFLGESFKSNILQLEDSKRIDIGCCLEHGTFTIDYFADTPQINYISKENNLISFFLKLVELLQKSATVPAIEIDKYLSSVI